MFNRVLIAAAACALAVTALLTAPVATAGAGTPVAARATAPDCGATTRRGDGTAWICTFSDNFSGSALDTGKWAAGDTRRSGFNVGHTCFQPGNVTVGGGVLSLTSRATRSFWCRSFLARYTGGLVQTGGKFSQTYGRFEVRARYPRSGPGLRAGFWMYPDRMIYGGWPTSGEIDVSEWWSNASHIVLPTLHYRASGQADSGWDCKVADPTVWHNYRVVWKPDRMVFFIDGTRCFARQWQPAYPMVAPKPFDHPFHLILNMAVDANSTNNAPTASTALPATYQVDWVRAWR